MSVTVDRVHDQRVAALKRANGVKAYRAGVKRRLANVPTTAGLRATAGLVNRPSDELLTMKVGDLLRAPRRVGLETVRVWLRRVGIRDSLELGRLSPRQRMVLT